jgi:hypothetical protein
MTVAATFLQHVPVHAIHVAFTSTVKQAVFVATVGAAPPDEKLLLDAWRGCGDTLESMESGGARGNEGVLKQLDVA